MKYVEARRRFISEGEIRRRILNYFKRHENYFDTSVRIRSGDPYKFQLIVRIDETLVNSERPSIPDKDLMASIMESHILGKSGWLLVSISYMGGEYRVTLEASPFSEKPRELYHITHLDNLDSILKKGLIPKRNTGFLLRSNDPRIYLTTNYEDAMHDLLLRSEPIAILKIDMTKFSKFNVYEDPRMNTPSYWTPTHIPARALEVIYTSDD